MTDVKQECTYTRINRRLRRNNGLNKILSPITDAISLYIKSIITKCYYKKYLKLL